MAAPLSSSDQKQLQAVDTALEQYLEQAEQGKGNANALASIQQQLSQLVNNSKIPDSVRQTLQASLQELKDIQTTGSGTPTNLGPIYNIKTQIDTLIFPIGDSSSSQEGGEGKLSGGSLGGGSEE